MKRVAVALVGLMLAGTAAFAANSVVVESKSVTPGAANISIGIFLSNDDTLDAVVCPLTVRSLTGNAFITSLALKQVKDSRMNGRLEGSVFNLTFNILSDSGCHRGKPTVYSPGFKAPLAWQDTLSHPVAGPPAGILFTRLVIYPTDLTLPPGSDISMPSFRLIFNAGMAEGTFEIDTTCTTPSNHLIYSAGSISNPIPVLPSFTKGIITVGPIVCNCSKHGNVTDDADFDVFDVIALIDYEFAGGTQPLIDPACPHIDRGDVNCDGVDDVLDIVRLIDFVFAGGVEPCNPCLCSPYPANCP